MDTQVIIIGAGPSGMAAAHALTNNNIPCIVIDKQTFPRNKLCAGGVTQKAKEILDQLDLKEEFNGENTIVSSRFSLNVGYKHIKNINTQSSTHLVDRYEFDEYLVNTYKNKGGKILEGTKVESIDPENNTIRLSNNQTLKYQYLIGADGATGITKSLINKDFRTNGFCLQIEINREEYSYPNDKISLYYGIIPYGYGWIFPKKNHITVGFGANYNDKIDYKQEFDKFLKHLGIAYDKKDVKGAFVPFGEYIKHPIDKDNTIILIGDAAGLADPISGEGIYYSLLSGIKSADTITKAIEHNDREILEEYIKEIKPITKNISRATKLKKPIYKHRNMIFSSFKNENIASLLFEKCLYNSEYNFNIIKK